MTTLLQRGVTAFSSRIKTAAGRSVTITRQSNSTATITGACASNAYSEVGEDGLQTSVTYDDWTFTAADIVISSTTVEPRDGDVITETINGDTVKWEVLPLQNKPCTEWLDTTGTLLLVHTRRIQ